MASVARSLALATFLCALLVGGCDTNSVEPSPPNPPDTLVGTWVVQQQTGTYAVVSRDGQTVLDPDAPAQEAIMLKGTWLGGNTIRSVEKRLRYVRHGVWHRQPFSATLMVSTVPVANAMNPTSNEDTFPLGNERAFVVEVTDTRGSASGAGLNGCVYSAFEQYPGCKSIPVSMADSMATRVSFPRPSSPALRFSGVPFTKSERELLRKDSTFVEDTTLVDTTVTDTIRIDSTTVGDTTQYDTTLVKDTTLVDSTRVQDTTFVDTTIVDDTLRVDGELQPATQTLPAGDTVDVDVEHTHSSWLDQRQYTYTFRPDGSALLRLRSFASNERLEMAATWRVDGDTLTLTDEESTLKAEFRIEDGRLRLQFQPKPLCARTIANRDTTSCRRFYEKMFGMQSGTLQRGTFRRVNRLVPSDKRAGRRRKRAPRPSAGEGLPSVPFRPPPAYERLSTGETPVRP